MDLARAEQILNDLQEGSKKVARIGDAVDQVHKISGDLKLALGEFSQLSKQLAEAEMEASRSKDNLLKKIQPAVSSLESGYNSLKEASNSLKKQQEHLQELVKESVSSAQAPLVSSVEESKKEITSQVHRDAGATHQAVSNLAQTIVQQGAYQEKISDALEDLSTLIGQQIKNQNKLLIFATINMLSILFVLGLLLIK